MQNKQYKIDIVCNDGSPLGVTLKTLMGNDSSQIGVGGAELALMTMCEAWHNAGHRVRLYNNPRILDGSPFFQLPIADFRKQDDRDILIIFRSPVPFGILGGATGKKIWWSTDQYTVGDFQSFASQVNEIVTISQFHSKYFQDTYNIGNTTVIDLPVRTWEYVTPINKIKNRIIFCSVPDRGLDILARSYDELVQKVPGISLTITSDYRLWGVGGAMNEQYIRKFFHKSNVRFLGAVHRSDLVKEQQEAEILAYPCTYDELFCYSVAECQVAGTIPITPSIGALETTNMGIQITGNVNTLEWKQAFISTIVEQLGATDLKSRQETVRTRALQRFSIDRILGEWQKIFQ